MKEHGVDQPIVVNEHGIIIKGHGRLMAAKLAGMETFPVVVKRGLTEEQKRAERIADNQIALLAGWDLDMIKLELTDLTLSGYDMPQLRFRRDLAGGLPRYDCRFGRSRPDARGAVDSGLAHRQPWHLGRHRLLCGDATKAEDVARVLGKSKPHLMVTDPPWGVEYDPNWRNTRTRNGRVIGAASLGKVMNDDQSDWREAWINFTGDVAYIWHANRKTAEVALSLRAVKFALRAQIIWRKNRTIIGRGDYHYNHEPCWYAVREGKTGHWTGKRDQGTVWDIAGDLNTTGHGTQKPVECMLRPIINNSKPGEAVYDPFVGSGTTLIAAEMTGRKAFMLEIDPRYCDCVVERWQNFTGRKATLDGHSFEALAPERREANKDWKEMWGKEFELEERKKGARCGGPGLKSIGANLAAAMPARQSFRLRALGRIGLGF